MRTCEWAFTQATDARGRVAAKVRHGKVYITIDVPEDTFLEDWGKTPYKPLPGYVVFYETKGSAARETLSWEAGNGVGYVEEFRSGSITDGSYICRLTIAAPKLVMTSGGPPRPFVAPTPRDYAYLPPALAYPVPPVGPHLSKQQRYDARMSLMGAAQGKLNTTPNAPAQTALTRLQRNNVAVERARLSSHVYHSLDVPPVPAPEGWHMLSAKELASKGVTPAMLLDPESGFKAALYQSSFERPPKLVIAYAGTEDKPDMKADLIQGLGLESKQHNSAMNLARAVAEKTDFR